MPTPGLSLVGFMDQTQAINHLRTACVPADNSDAALISEWNAAQAKRGPSIANAGNPDIQPLPNAHPHVQQLTAALQPILGTAWLGATLSLVEIDPLLAYQFTVDKPRAAHHCAALVRPPTLDELLQICLPLTPQSEALEIAQGAQSVLLKARTLNLQVFAQGMINVAFMGIQFGMASPYAHVVRHNGRCYLHNGFHRAYGARMAGATHIPCVLRDVPDHAAVGIRTDGGTFSATLLESGDAPTLAHFTRGLAYEVMVRLVSRVLHVSWAEYVVPEE
jgi:hypothetical protein